MGVGAVCRPMVGVAVPCDPHGVNHIEDVDKVDEGPNGFWPCRVVEL